MSADRILIFTATLNERDNIFEFCKAIFAASPQSDLLIVDDNSPDGTGHLLRRMQETEPRLKVIHRPQKLGLGTAHKLAMVYAIKNGYDTLITMDADWSHAPEDIPRLIKRLETADFVIGSRYIKGGTCDYVGYRRNISILANLAARFLLRVPTYEFTTSFRAFRIPFLKKIGYGRLRSRGYSFFMEVVYRVHEHGGRIGEIPIHFADRKAGTSKIPKYEIFKSMYRLLFLTFSRFFPPAPVGKGTDLGNLKCYLCASPNLVELHPKKQSAVHSDSKAYRCTSMEHHSQPQVVSCLECGLDFVPDRDSLHELYSDVVDEQYLEFKDARYKTFENVFNRVSKYIPANGKLLEVGSYCGFFLETARKHGIRVEGVEPSAWASRYAREELKLNVHQGTLEQIQPTLERSYDTVAMWDVLEHLSDPLVVLANANVILKENGYLLLSTLDVDNWFPKLAGSRWPWLMDMHVFYFRTPALKSLLRKAGFEVVNVGPYSHYISCKYLIDKMAALLPTPLNRMLLLLRPLLPKSGIFIPFQFGDIKLYVCKKVPASAPVPEDDEFPNSLLIPRPAWGEAHATLS